MKLFKNEVNFDLWKYIFELQVILSI